MERATGFEPVSSDWKSEALAPGRRPQNLVPEGGIEPPTRWSSTNRSTNELLGLWWTSLRPVTPFDVANSVRPLQAY
jgi:hypothetical protein